MEDFILDILARIRELGRGLAANELEDIVRAHNQGIRDNKSHISKRRALPFFLKVRESDRSAGTRGIFRPTKTRFCFKHCA